MANLASLIVKIGAQDAEIQDALAKLGQKAKSVDADLSKIGNTPLGQAAQKALAEMQTAMNGITQAQERLAERARFASAGLENLGGVSRLTRNELDQVNRTLQNGLDAFRALGQEAPKDLQRVADAVGKQREALTGATSQTSLLGVAQGALTSQLLAFAGPAALGFAIKRTLDYADGLTKMSDRTGIGVVALQRLESIASASGNTIEDLAVGINQFQKRIAEGSIDEPIRRLGLSVGALRALAPDEQFIAIAKAIQQIHDPAEQARNAMEVFGKTGAALLPSLKSPIDQLANATVKMSAESVKALDDFGDSLGHLKTSALNVLGEIAAGAIRAGAVILDLPGSLEKALQDAHSRSQKSFGAQQASNISKPGSVDAFGNVIDFLPPLASPEFNLTAHQRIPSAKGSEFGIGILADAESAQKAIRGFVDELRQAADFAAKVSAAQDTLFSRALSERARVFAAALGDVDRLSKLDSESLGQLNSIVKAGIRQYSDLGERVPKNLRDVSDAIDLTVHAQRLLNGEAHDATTVFGKFVLTLDETRNLALGLTHDGLLPMAAGFNDAARAAAGAASMAAQLKRSRDALITQVSGTIGLPNVTPQNGGALSEARDNGKNLLEGLQGLVSGDELGKLITQSLLHGGGAGRAFEAFGSEAGGLMTKNLADSIKDSIGGKAGSILGGIIGPLGALAGPIISGLGKLFHGTPEWQKFQKDVGRDLGVNISDGLAQALEKDSQRFGRQAASLLHLDQIIGEAGGVEAFGLDKAISKAHDLFSVMADGKLTVQQVGGEFSKIFNEIVPNAIDKATGLGSKAFLDLAATARTSGIKAPSLQAFDQSQIQTGVLGGLGAFLGAGNTAAEKAAADQKTLIDLQGQLASATGAAQNQIQQAIEKTSADLKTQQAVISVTSIHTQGAADAVSAAILGSFTQLQQSGLSFTDSLSAVTPAINGLQEQLDRTGTTGGAAFTQLKTLSDLASDSIAGPAFAAVDGLGKAMAGLENTGLLTQATFEGLSGQVTDTFNGLVAQGKNGDDALKLMQPTLQTIYELQSKFGFKVDDATQALLDQADAQGLVGEKFKTPQQQMIDGLDKISSVLLKIAEKLGADLPDAAKTGAQGISDELAKIKVPDITIGVDFQARNGIPAPDGAATGGLVTPFGIQHFAAGGRVLPFLPRGTDTVPIMASPGEVILNEAQQGRVAASILANRSDDLSALHGEVKALREDNAQLRRFLMYDFSDVIGRKMRDNVQKVSRR